MIFAVEKCFSDVWWGFISAEKCHKARCDSSSRRNLMTDRGGQASGVTNCFPCYGCAVHIIFICIKCSVWASKSALRPENDLFLNKPWNLKPSFIEGCVLVIFYVHTFKRLGPFQEEKNISDLSNVRLMVAKKSKHSTSSLISNVFHKT